MVELNTIKQSDLCNREKKKQLNYIFNSFSNKFLLKKGTCRYQFNGSHRRFIWGLLHYCFIVNFMWQISTEQRVAVKCKVNNKWCLRFFFFQQLKCGVHVRSGLFPPESTCVCFSFSTNPAILWRPQAFVRQHEWANWRTQQTGQGEPCGDV